jgi:hypothetical protein
MKLDRLQKTPSNHCWAPMRFALFIVLTVLFNGCVHTTPRLLPFGGTVLDERTHAPIVGAKIFLAAHPEVTCKSDSSGNFKFKEIVNWHYGYTFSFVQSEDLPPGEQWGYDVTVSYTNYIPQQASLTEYSDHVILLKRLDKPSETHPWLIFNGSGEILKDMGAGQYLKPGDIRIVGHMDGKLDADPTAIHIGFLQRVYDPQITPVNSPDRASIVLPEPKGLDWEFRIEYSYDNLSHRMSDPDVKDSSREYRLEFIP